MIRDQLTKFADDSRVESLDDLGQAVRYSDQRRCDIILLASQAFGLSAPELVARFCTSAYLPAILVLDEEADLERGIECMRAGAADYVAGDPAGLASLEDRIERIASAPNNSGFSYCRSLRRERDLLRQMIDLVPSYLYMRDAEGRYLVNNRANLNLLGVESEAETIGRTMQEFFPEETAERFSEGDQLAVQEGGVFNLETPYVDHQGTPGWLLTSKMPVHDENGKVIGLVGISRDITRRRQAEDALRTNEERMRLFLEHAPVSVAVFDREMKFLLASRRWKISKGLAKVNLLGKSYYDIVPDIPEAWRRIHRDCLAGCKRHNDEDLWKRADGTEEWVRWDIHPWMESKDQVGGIILFSESITAEKRVQIREQALARLGKELGIARTKEAAARVVVEVAQDLVGWDSTFLDLYYPESDYVVPVLNLDTVDGQTVKVPPSYGYTAPSPFQRSVIKEGTKLINRTGEEHTDELVPFGDTGRRSASMIFVPLRARDNIIGVLSVQSYSPGHYNEESLETMRTLSNHCAGALERIQVEERLRESEEKYRSLVETSQDLMWTVDAEGRWTYLNRAAKSIYGYEVKHMLGRKFVEFVPPGLRGKDEETFADIKTGEERFSYETTHLRSDGTEVHLSYNAIPCFDDQGQFCGSTGTARDISEQKKAESALRESEERYRQLVELSPDAVIVHLDGKINFANAATANLLGAESTEQLHGVQIFDLLQPQSRELALRRTRQILTQGKSMPLADLEFRRLDGTIITVEATSGPIHFNGQTAVLAVFRDITERKQVEQRLRRLAAAVENAVEAICIIDLKGHYAYANPAYLKSTGFNEAELLDAHFDMLERMDDKGKRLTFDELRRKIEKDGMWNGKFTTTSKDGHSAIEEASIAPMRDEAGTTTEYLAVKRDITKESQLEEQVQLAQKMEAVGILAGGIAHDFNNLLQIIQGHAEIGQRITEEETPIRRHLSNIVNSTKRASRLTRRLLTFGKQQPLARAYTELTQVVSDMLGLAQRLIGPNIEVHFNSNTGALPIFADKGQLEQCLLNIIINARDAMPEGGTLDISLSEVSPEDTPRPLPKDPERVARLSIRDSGHGMDAQTMSRIFEPFFSTKAAESGTGLGLAVVYGIIQQHDGMIEVDSEAGSGSEFRIFLPLSPDASRSESAEGEAGTATTGKATILLAEDEPAVRELSKTILETAGYEVLTAENGQIACEIFVQHQDEIDMLLFDVVMPQLTGPDAYDRICETHPDIPILFCSGYTGTALMNKRDIESKMPFLPKPFTMHDLLNAVSGVLNAAEKED